MSSHSTKLCFCAMKLFCRCAWNLRKHWRIPMSCEHIRFSNASEERSAKSTRIYTDHLARLRRNAADRISNGCVGNICAVTLGILKMCTIRILKMRGTIGILMKNVRYNGNPHPTTPASQSKHTIIGAIVQPENLEKKHTIQQGLYNRGPPAKQTVRGNWNPNEKYAGQLES